MTNSRSSRWRGIGVPVTLLVLTALYGWGALNIRAQFDEGLVGPNFLPLLLTGIVAVGLLVIIVKQWCAKPDVADTMATGNSIPEPALKEHWRPALVAGATFAYIAVFKLLGYPLATLGFAFVLLTLFGYSADRVLRRAIAALIITAIFYILFAIFFSVRLPLLPGAAS